MNQKQIGIVVLIIGLLLSIFTYMDYVKEDAIIDSIIEQQGSCYLDDGTCLHDDRNYTQTIFLGIFSGALVILGLYLIFFDKTQEKISKYHENIVNSLERVKEKDKKKDEFKAFLSGFNEDEKKVLEAVKEQDGIKQSTLRFRAGMSKTSLSLMLKSLEERDIIKRKPSGKTNEVYLRKKF